MQNMRTATTTAIIEEPPIGIKEGGIIKLGYDEEIDLLKKATTDEEAESILTKWAESPVSGNMAFEQGFNLMQQYVNFKRKYLGCDLTVFGLYDLVAFDNFAFENEGYDTREQFRALTAADFALGMTLSCMYFNLHQNEQYEGY